MSAFQNTSALAAAAANRDTDRSPRRKLSTDLMRIKNFPSTLSLRKTDPDTPPRSDASAATNGTTTGTATGTFSRLRALGQSQRPSRSSLGAEQADTSADSKSSRRTSRLLDAFKPSKKQTPSFEVVRKPPNRSTASFHSRPSTQEQAQTLEPAPRISLSAPTPDPAMSPPPAPISTSASPSAPNNAGARSQYPPSTTRTRRLSNNLPGITSRRTSDPYAHLGVSNPARAHSPTASPNMDAVSGSFSLHSFRNVRSASDVSTPDDPSVTAHSRVHSIISVDEYVTPGEELPEPRFLDDQSVATDPIAATATTPEVNLDQSTSPVANARPASISAARFRQASRQRSESGNLPTLDGVQPSGSALLHRPPRSRTPSQDLAAMEAVLAQTHQRTPKPVDADRRRSTGAPTALPSAPAVPADEPQRRKRGFFVVVEGLDRAGKSTQVERLAQHLGAKPIKFPERTTAIGEMINSYLAQTSELDDQAIHLLFSANRWECVAAIRKTLDAGESIVCDRYAFSGIAYSVAKGLAYDWCRGPDVGLPLPDLTLFLDLDAQTAAARGGYGEERYEKLDFQAKVRDAFARVANDVRSNGGRWVTVDAGRTLDQVTDEIQRAVHRVTSSIDRVGGKLGRLFVSDRPAAERGGSSSELLPPMAMARGKRGSGSEDEGRRGKSLDQPRIHIDTAAREGAFPAARPSGSPLSYTEQLAAVRAAAAGTLSGLFGGSNATLDQQVGAGAGEGQADEGPSPVNAQRGQGFDSARVLAKYPDGGRRRTLIDVIGEIEGETPPTAWAERRRAASAAEPTNDVASMAEARTGGLVPPRLRRSTDQGRPTASPDEVDKPLPSPSSMHTFGPSAGAGEEGLVQRGVPPRTTLSPAMTTSSRSSVASPGLPARPASASPEEGGLSAQQLSMLNVQQGQAEWQEQAMRNYMAMMANPLLAQQAQYQLMLQRHQQQYYGRAASAMGANTNLGAGANGNGVAPQPSAGPPLAAFMQPGQPQTALDNGAGAGHKERSRHKRTQSSGSLLENGQSSQPAASAGGGGGGGGGQPMLSMMMAPPPAPSASSPTTPSFAPQYYPPQMYAQPAFYGAGFGMPPGWGQQMAYGGRPAYASTRSEIATPSARTLRPQRSGDHPRPPQ